VEQSAVKRKSAAVRKGKEDEKSKKDLHVLRM